MLPNYLKSPNHSYGRINPASGVVILWLFTVLAISVAIALLVWNIRVNELARAEREIDNLSQVLAEQTARSVQGVEAILRETEQRLRAGQATHLLMDGRSIHTLLHARISGTPQVRALSLVDAGGHLQHTSTTYPRPNISVADRNYFTMHRDHYAPGLYIDHPIKDRLDGGWSLPISWRISSQSGGHRSSLFRACVCFHTS